MSDTTEALRAALAAGPTPGPWMWDSDPIKGDPLNRVRFRVVARGRTVTQCYYSSGDEQAEPDARLIAAACNAAPSLLAELDALKAERDALRAALAASEAQAGPVAFSARPLEWGDDTYTGQWVAQHGFCIIHEPGSAAPYSASWGEGDAEEFATLEDAKAWCQQELDAWVRQYVVAHPPAAQAEQPAQGAGPALVLKTALPPEDIAALTEWSAALASAPRVPQGWKIERDGGRLLVSSPKGARCAVSAMEDAPRVIPSEVLYMLASALIAATPQPEGGE